MDGMYIRTILRGNEEFLNKDQLSLYLLKMSLKDGTPEVRNFVEQIVDKL